MKRLGISLVVPLTFASMLIGGQSQAALAPSAPTKAVEVAQAAAPAQKETYPTPGKPITIIVPYAAGGGTNVAAQKRATLLEKILKPPVVIVNRPGAGSQVGVTELVRAKPDGYTIGYGAILAISVFCFDPERKAIFTRKNFQPIASHYTTAKGMHVLSSSPFKTLKDLVGAARWPFWHLTVQPT